MNAVRCIALLATLSLAVSVAAASDELVRAKDLYRSASYDEALLVLEELAGDASGSVRTEANEYRVFCLIALDRRLDARAIIEAMITTDPFYQMTTDQASPRVRALFKDIRQSMLPDLVQKEYAAARTAFEGQDPEAAVLFDRVLTLLADPLLTQTPALTDLRTVATGFRDLSKARVKKPETPATPPPPLVALSLTMNSVPAPKPGQVSTSVKGPFREGDPDVVPPVAVSQAIPQWIVPQGTRPGAWQPEAAIELTIDESGNVSSVQLRKSFHPSYDPVLVKAAASWKYEPARRNGIPVRFIKYVIVRLGSLN